jgi:hypothetical protein
MPKTLAMDDVCEGKDFSFPSRSGCSSCGRSSMPSTSSSVARSAVKSSSSMTPPFATGLPHYGHILAVHFVYSANGEGEFCALLAFDSCSSFNTKNRWRKLHIFNIICSTLRSTLSTWYYVLFLGKKGERQTPCELLKFSHTSSPQEKP